MCDLKRIREAIDSVTAQPNGWAATPTWGQIFHVLALLLAPTQLGGMADFIGRNITDAEAAPTPDALRERAIRAVAEGYGLAVNVIKGDLAIPGAKIAPSLVAAVARALREVATTRECEMCTRPAQYCGVCRGEPGPIAEISSDTLRERAVRLLTAIGIDWEGRHNMIAIVECALRDERSAVRDRILDAVRTGFTARRRLAFVTPGALPVPYPIGCEEAAGFEEGIRLAESEETGHDKARKRRDEWRKHVATRDADGFVACHCKCDEFGEPIPASDCEEGQHLAAAVKEIADA